MAARNPVRRLVFAEAKICFILYRNRCFGKGHMLIDNVVGGFPTHEKGDAEDAVRQLLREGILRRKSSVHGPAVFIDASIREHIRERTREHAKFAWLPP